MQIREITALLRKIILGILCVTAFSFPLLFLTNTTDPFTLARQVIIVIVAAFTLLLWAVISVYQRKIILRTNPFNLPVGLFTLMIFISALLSRNMYDSLSLAIPVVSIYVIFFVTVNTIFEKREFMFLFASLILGAVVATIVTILYFFGIYFLPITAAQTKYFTSFGSPLQHLLYITPLFITCLFMALKDVRTRNLKRNYEGIFYLGTGLVLLAGTVLILYQIITIPQKPNLLPYTFGFQIATAAISQDANRLLISLPLGSGYGTFLSDFTRFKLPNFNNNQTLWNIPFTYSSSFVLELLATTGILGLLAYLFIVARILRNRGRTGTPLFLSIITVLVLSFFLPFSLTLVFLFYALVALYASYLYLAQDKRTDTVRVSLVALRDGLLSVEESSENSRRGRSDSIALPLTIVVVVLLLGGYASFLAVKLALADTKIAKSLAQSSRSNGQAIYDLQRGALIDFPYRSDYYRIFSQVNLALANSVSQSIPQGSSPSAQIQQTVSQLLQQSVGNARTAVALAPLNAINWDNLGQIYRNLIGVGQNADQFTIATLNQAVLLDPSNPLLRLELGGVYYQLAQYDGAQNQFQVAIQLKPDLANAYYNLGHALESKKDLNNALSAYQATLSLLPNNSADAKKLKQEIDAISKKIGQQQANQGQQAGSQEGKNQPPLGLTAPTTPAPTSSQQIKVAPPPTGATPSVSPIPTTKP